MEHIVWTWWTTDTMTMGGAVQDHLHVYLKRQQNKTGQYVISSCLLSWHRSAEVKDNLKSKLKRSQFLM